jgi:hypothetical protein
MWDLIHCYLSGRHDYGIWCESGEMFLRCVHCGKRSSGWSVETKFRRTAPLAAAAVPAAVVSARVIPFDRPLGDDAVTRMPQHRST